MQRIIVPSWAVPYVLLQRLETQKVGSQIHYTRLGHAAYRIYESFPWAKRLFRTYTLHVEARLRRKDIARTYSDLMAREFESIRDHLPDSPEVVVGIGPGMAGLEAYLSQHYGGRGVTPRLVLIDESRIDDIHYGYHETAAAYNHLELAKRLLVCNGHPSGLIDCVEASDLANTRYTNVNLITSLIAWGFHFPVDTYLDFAFGALSSGGTLIIDVRKGTDGRHLLEDRFGGTSVILDDEKFERVKAVKQASSE